MWLLVRFIHVLAAMTWVGGMLFVALVLVPVMRHLPDQALRARLVHQVGVRFRGVGWCALGLLVLTGLLNLWRHPFLLGTRHFQVKLAVVTLTLVLSLVHDFVLGPRAGVPGAPPEARRRAVWLARANVVVALTAVALGLSLLRS